MTLLMRFDKMETYAEYSLQLTSQGPQEAIENFSLASFLLFIGTVIFNRHFSVDFHFSRPLCITFNQRTWWFMVN